MKDLRPRASLLLALLLMGLTFTVTQVMVIRELLVVFLGNELSISVILANWLLLEAAGSFFLGRRIKGASLEKGYALLQLLLSLLLPLTIYGIRCLRDFAGLAPGEGGSLVQIFVWTALILAPLGVVDGLLFAFGCGLYSASQRATLSVGRVYLLEALGAGAGGILYTFFLIPFFHSFEVALLLGAANLVSALLLASSWQPPQAQRTALAPLLWLFLILDLALLTAGARILEKSSLERQWKGLRILESRWSPYGNVAVGQREDQLTFFSNGTPICTAPVPDVAFVEEKVHYPLLLLSAIERVLVIGGGFGGILAEVLKHPVGEVHYAEIDPLIIRMIRENQTDLTRREIENPRVRVHPIDARLHLKTAKGVYDAILVNLPVPSTLELNRFYTVDFFGEAFRALRKNGLLALHLPGSETYLSPEVRDLNLCLKRSLQAVFPRVNVVPGEVNFLLAFSSADPGLFSAERLIGRLESVAAHYIHGPLIRLKFDAHRLKWLEDSLDRGRPVSLNRDARPAGLYYSISYWNARFHPGLQVFWGKAERLTLWHFALPLLILTGGALFLPGKKWEPWAKGATGCVVATTGFFGMAAGVLLIFAFQTLYGYAYQWIGVLIAAFMAGLALGTRTMIRHLEKRAGSIFALAVLEGLIILFLVLAVVLLALLYNSPGMRFVSLVQTGFLLLNLTAGYLVGLEFPLAACLFSGGDGRVVRTAGTLYAADLFGAFWGSLLAGVILAPALGILQALGVVMGVKAVTLALLRPFGGWRRKASALADLVDRC